MELGFPGFAIGGLSVGESFEVFRDLLALTAALLPESGPLSMGVGTPEYILEAVENGIDMMDCVFPTRTARNAQAFTRWGTLNLRNEVNRLDPGRSIRDAPARPAGAIPAPTSGICSNAARYWRPCSPPGTTCTSCRL